MNNAQAFEAWRDGDENTVELTVERGHIERGASFSKQAFRALADQTVLFVGARVLRRWDDTNEPPTVVHVTITVDVQ